MQTVYCTFSKAGKELEKEFTSLERANADLYLSDYYNGVIIVESVTDDEFAALEAEELEIDECAIDECQLTRVQQYNLMIAGIE